MINKIIQLDQIEIVQVSGGMGISDVSDFFQSKVSLISDKFNNLAGAVLPGPVSSAINTAYSLTWLNIGILVGNKLYPNNLYKATSFGFACSFYAFMVAPTISDYLTLPVNK